jgi:hypothetical protein
VLLFVVEANELFDAYRELYFEGGLSSVYLWDLDGGFAGCFLIKKGMCVPTNSRVLRCQCDVLCVCCVCSQRWKVIDLSARVCGTRFTSWK